MKKIQYLVVLCFCTFCSIEISAQHQNSKKLERQLKYPDDKNVMVIAHRGDWRNAPENSLMAFQYAIDAGVDVIEVDLAITKDGVIVIMHDHTIDRTSNGKGRPSEFTLKELKNFRLKNGLGRVTDHTVPTLHEVMELSKGKVLVNLDKSYDFFSEAFNVLKKTGTLHQAIFKANAAYSDVRKRYSQLLDSISFMPVVDLADPNARRLISDYQQHINPVAFELIFAKDTSAILSNLKLIRTSGSKVWVNSLWSSLNGGHDDDLAVDQKNKKASWDWLIERGFNMIQTDRPAEMLLYLRNKKLHSIIK